MNHIPGVLTLHLSSFLASFNQLPTLRSLRALALFLLVLATNSTMIEYLGGFGLKRMRVFRTMQGWVGKGPQSLRADYELWLVPGANVTFVLRRHSVDSSDDTHTYVGHAYVHGLMSGELKEEFKGRQLEKIALV